MPMIFCYFILALFSELAGLFVSIFLSHSGKSSQYAFGGGNLLCLPDLFSVELQP